MGPRCEVNLGRSGPDKQYRPPVIAYQRTNHALLLIFVREDRRVALMKHVASILAASGAWLALTGAAQAACFADYKARRDQPYGRHYGVVEVEISPCAMSAEVEDTVRQRVAAGGWTVLQVQSVFEDDGLAGRKKDAGEFFLRF